MSLKNRYVVVSLLFSHNKIPLPKWRGHYKLLLCRYTPPPPRLPSNQLLHFISHLNTILFECLWKQHPFKKQDYYQHSTMEYPEGQLDWAQDLLVIKYTMKFTPNQSILISCLIYTSSLQNKLCNIYLYIPYHIYNRNTRHCILSWFAV